MRKERKCWRFAHIALMTTPRCRIHYFMHFFLIFNFFKQISVLRQRGDEQLEIMCPIFLFDTLFLPPVFERILPRPKVDGFYHFFGRRAASWVH